jgi:sugar phosphate permease
MPRRRDYDWAMWDAHNDRSGFGGAVALGLAILAGVLATQGGWQGILIAVGLGFVVAGILVLLLRGR